MNGAISYYVASYEATYNREVFMDIFSFYIFPTQYIKQQFEKDFICKPKDKSQIHFWNDYFNHFEQSFLIYYTNK